jgi:nicotinate phosphoribosyltransferase
MREAGALVGDAIYDCERGLVEPVALHDIEHLAQAASVPSYDSIEDLLQPAMRDGRRVGAVDDLDAARARCQADLAALSPRSKRFLNPQPYVVGLDDHVHARKVELIAKARAR